MSTKYETVEAVVARAAEVRRELEALDSQDNLTAAEEARFDALVAEIDELARERRRAEVRELAKDARNIEAGVSYPHATPSGITGEARTNAAREVERWRTDDAAKANALDALRGEGGDAVAQAINATAGAYESAFRKWTRDPEAAHMSFTTAEREAWARMREYRATLALPGAVLPSPLDPTIILTNAGAINPLGQLARQATTNSNTYRFVLSDGVTASFDAELAVVSDDTPSLTEKSVTVHKAQAFVAASIEAAMDQPNFDAEVRRMFGDAAQRLEADKFMNGAGDGSNEPFGLITRLDGSSSEIAPTTAETFAAADVYKTQQSLPVRWRSGAVWLAELSTINGIDQFETTNGAKLFPRVGDANAVLLRRPLYEASTLDALSALDAGATADNFLLVFGDMSEAYGVVRRAGASIEYIPHVFDPTTGRPMGTRGWYMHWRVGGDTLTTSAAVVLSIPTTA